MHNTICLQIDEDVSYKDKLELLKKFKFVKFCNIWTNFEDTKMVNLILKISRPGVFGIRCVNISGILQLLCSWKNATWIEDDIKVVTEFPCLLGDAVLFA